MKLDRHRVVLGLLAAAAVTLTGIVPARGSAPAANVASFEESPSVGEVALVPTHAAVSYPDGYREWTHVKSMLIEEGHPLYDTFGGIHHVYANASALRTLRASDAAGYPDGAVFVFDLLAAHGADATIVEGERKLIGVMLKDGARYTSTGGWGFEAFGGNTRTPVGVDGAECFACHQAKADADYVFTEWRK